jgi:hypothetical protein
MDAQNSQLLNIIFERKRRHMPKKNNIHCKRKEDRGTHAALFLTRYYILL